MLELHTKKELKKIFLRSNMPFFILSLDYEKSAKRRVIMTYITEEEELALDNNNTININRGGKSFTIAPTDIEAYGVIDFKNNSNDMDTIMDFNWFNKETNAGFWLPSRYNYEEHCAYSDISVPRMYDTYKPELAAQYAHGCLGKPERCVIFKYYWPR